MANSIRKRAANNRSIYKIATADGTVIENQDELISKAASFYENHFKDVELEQEFIKLYIRDKIPKVNAEARGAMDQPLRLDEVKTAIASLKIGKWQGSDGLPNELHK